MYHLFLFPQALSKDTNEYSNEEDKLIEELKRELIKSLVGKKSLLLD